ncbi:MAG: FHA domain-containing protein [Chloroflexi bacterium]|nr:FHA domain-containing protein [Chloroflexota bacterium]MBN9396953.1 FHA domain-containing protein [Candidatus Melainabacteria bacterium]OJV92930.1 MAG: hypothetical protein BGO39_03160 [Chloroflexi bacterium 54-19]
MKFSFRHLKAIPLLCFIFIFLTTSSNTTAQSIKIENPDFLKLWSRTDSLVLSNQVSRTYLWGPAPFTGAIQEPYVESPGGTRLVQYFDKSRMEITHPEGSKSDVFYVSNGLLVQQLVSGMLQLGDNKFEKREPSTTGVAGDNDDTSGPTYKALGKLTATTSNAEGQPVAKAVDRAGNTRDANSEFGQYNITYAHFEAGVGHNIAKPFWDFLNITGPVQNPDGSIVTGRLFDPVFYATGLPITDAYWAKVKVGGQIKDVLIQAFERRVLTYTPSNSNGFQVEMGNVGRHFKDWLDRPPAPPATVQIRAIERTAANFDLKLVVTSDSRESIKEFLVEVKDKEDNVKVFSPPLVPFDPANQETDISIPIDKLTPGQEYVVTVSANDRFGRSIISNGTTESTILATDSFTYPLPPTATILFDARPQLDSTGKNFTANFTINTTSPQTIEKILVDVVDDKDQPISPPLAPIGFDPKSKTVQITIPVERLRPDTKYTVEVRAKNKDDSFVFTPNNSNILGTSDFSYSSAALPKPVTIKLRITQQTKDATGKLFLPVYVEVQDPDKRLDPFRGFVKCQVTLQANNVDILKVQPDCSSDSKDPSTFFVNVPLTPDTLKPNQDYVITVDILTPATSNLNITSGPQTFKPILLAPPGFFESVIQPNLILIITTFLAILIFIATILYFRNRPRKREIPAPLPNPYSEATMIHAIVPRVQPAGTMVQNPVVPNKKSLQLIIRVRRTPDQQQIRQEVFGNFPVVIGRQVNNSYPVVVGPNGKFVILGDPKISGNHIEIRREADNFILVDLNSTNGTIVNGGMLEKGGRVSFNKPTVVELGPNTTIELNPQI